jgi:hypothetical protein
MSFNSKVSTPKPRQALSNFQVHEIIVHNQRQSDVEDDQA